MHIAAARLQESKLGKETSARLNATTIAHANKIADFFRTKNKSATMRTATKYAIVAIMAFQRGQKETALPSEITQGMNERRAHFQDGEFDVTVTGRDAFNYEFLKAALHLTNAEHVYAESFRITHELILAHEAGLKSVPLTALLFPAAPAINIKAGKKTFYLHERVNKAYIWRILSLGTLLRPEDLSDLMRRAASITAHAINRANAGDRRLDTSKLFISHNYPASALAQSLNGAWLISLQKDDIPMIMKIATRLKEPSVSRVMRRAIRVAHLLSERYVCGDTCPLIEPILQNR